MTAPLLRARAAYVGARLDLRDLQAAVESLPESPRALRAGGDGFAFLYRWGAVVLVGVTDVEAAAYLEELRPRVVRASAEAEHEVLDLELDGGRGDRVDADGVLRLVALDPGRLEVVADVLAKSVALAHHERRVARVMDRCERLAIGLSSGDRPRSDRELLREIGDVLLIQTTTVGRVEVTEKPEVTWDRPDLDRLHEHLALEFELHPRDVALSRKLDLISRTAETYLELMHNRRSLRVEWYIVLLIVVEIGLTLYELFVSPGGVG